MPNDSRTDRRRTKAYLKGDFKLDKVGERQMTRVLFDPGRKAAMDFSSKSGCTVAVKMFLRQMGLLEEAVEYHPWIHRYRRDVFYGNHPTTPADVLDRSNDLFKVVRDPYTRVVSSFRYASRANLQRGRRLADGTSDNTKKTRVIEALGLDDVSQLSFRRFLDYLESIDLSRGDSHLMRQVRCMNWRACANPSSAASSRWLRTSRHSTRRPARDSTPRGSHRLITPQSTPKRVSSPVISHGPRWKAHSPSTGTSTTPSRWNGSRTCTATTSRRMATSSPGPRSSNARRGSHHGKCPTPATDPPNLLHQTDNRGGHPDVG
ncbi:sulfotransferase family 2 domain-containing protein [bacterium]|nr:sulfotransferase family 2 domain-containing protein [bacterium]